ncbi:MAG: hypothetical protein PHV34_04575 [Verrucomicrobiae bacterium]|nr:hypothetical protein [Verrucomicrobiae bacterium]
MADPVSMEVPLPATLAQAHAKLRDLSFQNQQLHWRVRQLEKMLFGPSADRVATPAPTVTEQALLNLFPAAAEVLRTFLTRVSQILQKKRNFCSSFPDHVCLPLRKKTETI